MLRDELAQRANKSDTTDETDFHGLGPLSGSAIRTTYSGVFKIRSYPLYPFKSVFYRILVLARKRHRRYQPARTPPPQLKNKTGLRERTGPTSLNNKIIILITTNATITPSSKTKMKTLINFVDENKMSRHYNRKIEIGLLREVLKS